MAGDESRVAKRLTKIKSAYMMTHAMYKKKALLQGAKIRHYQIVIIPDALHPSETPRLRNKTTKQKLEKLEQTTGRKFLVRITTEET